MRHIHRLPQEVLTDEIFAKLPLWAQWAARAVCKQWRSLLSSTTSRVREDYIVINLLRSLLLYNVTQARWMKPLPIHSLRIPKKADYCTVVGELFFFRNRRRPFQVATWNAATNENRVLSEVQPLPDAESDGCYEFGGYLNKTTGELQLLAFNAFGESDDRGAVGDLYLWKGGQWRPCFLDTPARFPTFYSRDGVVVFMDYEAPDCLHLFDAEKNSHTPLVPDATGWYGFEFHARFHFQEHGSYVLAFAPVAWRRTTCLGVLRFDVKKRKWELVCEAPEYMSEQAMEFSFCSDGVENIWVLLWSRSIMFRFNVVSRVWTSFPSALEARAERLDDDASSDVLFTTF